MNRAALPAQVLALARASVACGLNQGTSGNVSARSQGGFWITPSGRDLATLDAAEMVEVGLDGGFHSGLRPSSEWRMHRAIYAAEPGAQAVVHAHSRHAVTLACLRRGLPAFHYMVAVAGGHDIRCADYAPFGSQALSDAVIAALAGRRACLMANHGLLAWGGSGDQALALALEVENLCAQYLGCLAVGEPVLLSAAQMDEVLARFAHYRAGD